MQSLVFLATGVLLYFLADRVLAAAETHYGRRFAARSIWFFFILLGLALLVFSLLRRLGS